MPDLFEILAAAGPSAAIDDSRRLYAPLIGSWEVDATCYEPDGSSREEDEWHFDWILEAGDDVVQEGHALDGSSLERWTFSEITRDNFLWRGESSRDDGSTWRLDQEMGAARLKG